MKKANIYSSGGITCLRACKMCFEIKDESKRQFVVFREGGSYYGNMLVESRDEPSISPETKAGLSKAIEFISRETNSASYDAYRLKTWGTICGGGSTEFIEASLQDMKIAKNPAYIGNYCVALLCEIAKLSRVKTLPYLKELLPYLDKTTPIAGEDLDDYLKEIERTYRMPMEVRRPFYFALGKANLPFYRLPYLTEAIENELAKAITDRETGLKELLRRFPVIKASGLNADFVCEQYHGIGMKATFFISYMAKNGKAQTLYEALIENPSYFASSFEEEEGFSPMEVMRYLSSHGYEEKKKEIAKTLMKVVKKPQDYHFLQPFLSEEEVIEIFKNKPKEKGRWGDISKILPCLLGSRKVQNALKEPYVGYYKTERYCLPSCAYRYEDANPLELDEYQIKTERGEVRNCLLNREEGKYYFSSAIGLVAYGDKAIARYFLSEFNDSLGADPYFCLVKAYIGSTGKKVKDMYAYPEEE